MSENKKPYVYELIRNRRATKKMVADYTIDDDSLKSITEAIRWTSASYGVFSYRIIVLPKNSLRTELAPYFFNQSQFVNASHVILFVSAKEKYLRESLIEKSIEATVPVAAMRYSRVEAVYSNWKQNHVLPDWWAQKQAYIGLSSAMIAAADLGVATGPMEGFDKDGVNDILTKHNLINPENEQFVVALGMGKPDLQDPYVHFFEKVRMEESEFTTILKED
ncbi:nitroreductase family protein [Mesoplasma seiffertii]|uniref:nitroreductase family protein n=1 Tax=Mesoplasma seiffertii TaxID=28224 RepID=UPI000478744D|nr:nitroreductase family protein [Mesoplasma seiffertii]